MRPLKSLLVACCLMSSFVPTAGRAAAPLPTIESRSGTGPQWLGFKFTTDGSQASFEIGARKLSRGEYLAVYFYDEDDVLKAGAGWLSVGWKSGYRVDVPAAGVDIGVIDSPKPDGDMRIILTLNDPGTPAIVGTYKVLLLAAGDAQSWDAEVKGTGITGSTTLAGDRAFLFLGDDFAATANAEGHVLLDTPSAIASFSNIGARATIEGQLSLDISDTLLVDFGSAAMVPSQTFSIDSPDGAIDCGFYGCGFNRFEGPYHHGAGRYTFNTTGVNGGLSYMAELVLAGADARLPS